MSALLSGARRLTGRTATPIGERLAALGTAAELARGRLDDELADRAEAVVRRGSGRLALSGDHTVVALAGATGSGKSSTFNALSGVPIAAVSVRRPTTSATTAVVYGPEPADELLEWLGVQRRHQVAAEGTDAALDGLVLLDLPDHDSTEVAHHVEVERLVQLVDLLVWVLDPQKYADAAVHERFLRPLATHREVMIVVLNHIDEVAGADRAPMLADVGRLLAADGLDGVPVLGTSATRGDGIAELRALVGRRVGEKRAAAERLAADVTAVATELDAATGRADPADLDRSTRAQLVDAFADAAGVSTVVRAVERSVARRGRSQTGWPFVAWLGRLRPDPLKRLHLDLGDSGRELTGLGRASVPQATPVQRARVDTAVRAAAERVGAQLTPPWAGAVRRASTSLLPELEDSLDRAVVQTDLGADRTPVWWRLARLLQLLFALAVVGGVVWLGALAVLGYLQLPAPQTPERNGVPVPTLLLLLGLAGGIALAVVGRVLNGWVARRRARTAEKRLREGIAVVTDQLVLTPIRAELAAYDELRGCLRAALSR